MGQAQAAGGTGRSGFRLVWRAFCWRAERCGFPYFSAASRRWLGST